MKARKTETGSRPKQYSRGRITGIKTPASQDREARLAKAIQQAVAVLGVDIMELSPKDILLLAMRTAAKGGFIFKAAEIAAAVAPYVHPRLANVTTNTVNEDDSTSDEDLAAELEEILAHQGKADSANAVEQALSERVEGLGDSGAFPGGADSGEAPYPTLQ